MVRLSGLLLALALVPACTPGTPGEEAPAAGSARPEIAPGDFVALPCNTVSARPCLIVLAGGKRLMFGAPAGSGLAAEKQDLASLDALFLFSVHPADIEGVDEVRNRGWRAGRLDPLVVSGPEGTGRLVNGLNEAFEQADAISFVEEGPPAGGFDAALLEQAATITETALVYDSGDLKVRGATDGTNSVSYRVGYRDIEEAWHEIVLTPCGGGSVGEASYSVAPENRLNISCEKNGDGDGWQQVWPLREPVFIVRTVS